MRYGLPMDEGEPNCDSRTSYTALDRFVGSPFLFLLVRNWNQHRLRSAPTDRLLDGTLSTARHRCGIASG
jgi:hypothetical protein